MTQPGTTLPPRPAVANTTVSSNPPSISLHTSLDIPSMQAFATTSTIHSCSLASPTIRANFSAKNSSKLPSSVLLHSNPLTKLGTEPSTSSSDFSTAGRFFYFYQFFPFFFIFLLFLFANIVFQGWSLPLQAVRRD